MLAEHVGRADWGRAVICLPSVCRTSLHGFDEASPRVDGPSLIETDRFIGRVNHGVGWLYELRDNGIGHANIAVCIIGSIPTSDLGNSTCCSFTKGLQIVSHHFTPLHELPTIRSALTTAASQTRYERRWPPPSSGRPAQPVAYRVSLRCRAGSAAACVVLRQYGDDDGGTPRRNTPKERVFLRQRPCSKLNARTTFPSSMHLWDWS